MIEKLLAVFRGTSLRERTLSGGIVLLIGEFYTNIVRLGANLVMTRLLYPEAFGIMLVINLVFGALEMLSDVGVRSAIISRKENLDTRFLNVAWTIMIIRGFVLGAIGIILALPVATWYAQPELIGLIMLASTAPMISGFMSPYPRVAEREVQFGLVTLWQAIAQTSSLALTIVWLLIVPSVWALAANGVFSAVILTASSFLIFKGRVCFAWDPETARQLFHFGKWIVLGTALTFLGRQGDSLIVSRFLELDMLGVFSIAISLAKLIEMLAEKLGWGLLFPVYAEMSKETQELLAKQTIRLRALVYGVCFPIVVVLASTGRDLIAILYDERYMSAGWMLEILSLGMGFYVIAASINSIPLAFGDSKAHMKLQFYRVAVVFSFMLGGAWFFGTPGLIWGIAVGQMAYYPFLQFGVREYAVRSYLLDAGFSLALLLLVGAVWLVRGVPTMP